TDDDPDSEGSRANQIVDDQKMARGAAETEIAERVASAGHDLKNALQSIKLNATLLTGQEGGDPHSIARVVAIQSAVKRAAGIVEDLAELEAPGHEALATADSG